MKKEINIRVILEGEKIGTAINHKGFSENGYTLEQVLTTIGILENLKQLELKKLDNLKSITKG